MSNAKFTPGVWHTFLNMHLAHSAFTTQNFLLLIAKQTTKRFYTKTVRLNEQGWSSSSMAVKEQMEQQKRIISGSFEENRFGFSKSNNHLFCATFFNFQCQSLLTRNQFNKRRRCKAKTKALARKIMFALTLESFWLWFFTTFPAYTISFF